MVHYVSLRAPATSCSGGSALWHTLATGFLMKAFGDSTGRPRAGPPAPALPCCRPASAGPPPETVSRLSCEPPFPLDAFLASLPWTALAGSLCSGVTFAVAVPRAGTR